VAKLNEQEDFWANQYANGYIDKNSEFDEHSGQVAWQRMLAATENVDSILECGSNIGRNVEFLDHVLPQASKSIIELSKEAFDIVERRFDLEQTFNGTILDAEFGDAKFDLVFSMVVLIHIEPQNLLMNLKKMYDWSQKYILIGEYFSRVPEMIEYQGQSNKLFKRDFGKLFLENFSVDVVDYGFLWGQEFDAAGFDDITWWLFKKN
jgi:pseudaminic acid biosynthesis-associated methylase